VAFRRCNGELITDPAKVARLRAQPRTPVPLGASPAAVAKALTAFAAQPLPCVHLRAATGDVVECGTCVTKKLAAVHACAVRGRCAPTLHRHHEVTGCLGCSERAEALLVPGVPDPIAEPERPRPAGWAKRPEVAIAHAVALRELAARDFGTPERAEGDGIVTMGEGRFWPGLVVAVKVTREVTSLPVQVWYDPRRGAVSLDDLAGVPGVTFHDLSAVKPAPRSTGGWASKTTALLGSGLRRALWIDADAYFVADPAPLLELAGARRFVCWAEKSENVRWEWTGLRPAGVPPLLGGQLALDLVAFRRELVLAHWMNMHADYWHAHQYGEQDSWRVALTLTGGTYHVAGGERYANEAGRTKGTWYELGGVPLVAHRVHCKLRGDGADAAVPGLPGEGRVRRHLVRAPVPA
jgi:hypothetical protein